MSRLNLKKKDFFDKIYFKLQSSIGIGMLNHILTGFFESKFLLGGGGGVN